MRYARYIKRSTYRTLATLKTDVLRSWLDENDMTIDDLAKRLDVSSRSIKYWFKGRTITKENRERLCKETDMFPKTLFDFKWK